MPNALPRRPSLRCVTPLIVAMVTPVLTVGCDSVYVPSPSPSLAAPSLPVAPAPAPLSIASVVIEDAFAIGGPAWACTSEGCGPGRGYIYEVRFLLREVGGRSGATVKTITVWNPDNRTKGTYAQETGEGCWRDKARVPPDGTLDAFHTDEGSAWLSYCYVGIDGTPTVPSLDVDVHFVDDENNNGMVRATVTTFRR